LPPRRTRGPAAKPFECRISRAQGPLSSSKAPVRPERAAVPVAKHIFPILKCGFLLLRPLDLRTSESCETLKVSKISSESQIIRKATPGSKRFGSSHPLFCPRWPRRTVGTRRAAPTT
jgi:hypothetical protein